MFAPESVSVPDPDLVRPKPPEITPLITGLSPVPVVAVLFPVKGREAFRVPVPPIVKEPFKPIRFIVRDEPLPNVQVEPERLVSIPPVAFRFMTALASVVRLKTLPAPAHAFPKLEPMLQF